MPKREGEVTGSLTRLGTSSTCAPAMERDTEGRGRHGKRLGLAQLGHHGSDQGKGLAYNREYEACSQARVEGSLF